MNSESIGQELIDYIKNHACLPKHANYRHQYNGHGSNYKCYINWVLPDENRPHKSSKTIEIVISRNALNDYPSFTNKNRAKEKLLLIFNDFLSKFNPESHHSYIEPPLRETILIKSEDICNY